MVDEELGDERTTGPKLWIVLARAYRAIGEVLEDGIADDGMCLSDFMVLEVLLHGTGTGGARGRCRSR